MRSMLFLRVVCSRTYLIQLFDLILSKVFLRGVCVIARHFPKLIEKIETPEVLEQLKDRQKGEFPIIWKQAGIE